MVPVPRKILFVVNVLSRLGGAEVQLGILSRELARRGYETTIACISKVDGDISPVTDAGVRVIELGRRNRTQRPNAIPELVRLARAAEIVHCTMWDPSLWGRIAAIIARRPVIVADHAADRGVQVSASGAARAEWIKRHYQLLDPFTYATVACARSQLAVLAAEGVSRDKIVEIPNGVPIEDLRRAAAASPGRAAFNLPENVPLTVQIGYFRPEKNHIGAVETFATIRDRAPDAHFALIGDGAERPAVEARARELGVTDRVHFLGPRSDAAALLDLADLMVLPSLSDAMPMTVIEAMAVGVPVLATDTGDVRSMLGGAGVVVAPGDLTALGTAWVSLLDSSPERERLARVGEERARGFDAARMTDSYARLFEGAVSGEPPRSAVAGPELMALA